MIETVEWETEDSTGVSRLLKVKVDYTKNVVHGSYHFDAASDWDYHGYEEVDFDIFSVEAIDTRETMTYDEAKKRGILTDKDWDEILAYVEMMEK